MTIRQLQREISTTVGSFLRMVKRRLIRSLGFMTVGEYKELEKKLKREVMEAQRQMSSLEVENGQYKSMVASMPYDFDTLLKKYSANQMNAMVYKAINIAYWRPDMRYLLERWSKRCQDAQQNVLEHENNIKD